MRRVSFLTGKRGGWGAMVPTLRAIERSPDLELEVIACDMHADPAFGLTKSEIREDGFDPWVVAPWPLGRYGRSERLVTICLGLELRWRVRRPDIVLLLGDRGETLMAAAIAQQMGLFIAHIEGGDVTGSLDDSARHAISKLSHLHFCAYEGAAARLRAMGESNVVGS